MPNFSLAERFGSSTTFLRRWVSPAVHGVSDAVPLLIWLSLGMALVYAATIAYGLAAGYALPTATIFFLLPRPDLLARFEGLLPRAVLLIAFIGMSLGWLAKWGLADASRSQRNETYSARLLGRFGLFLVCAAFLFGLSDGGWSGRISDREYNYVSLAGLLPNSDGYGQFESPLEQILTGQWSPFASRRPFAAAMRQLTMGITDFSYVGTLLLQAVLIAAALFTAARSIVLWRGIWSGLAFCAFIYILAHPFLTTVLTEPLGLIWALLSIMFLVEAMRHQTIGHAYLALVALTFAEMTRMGSLFTIPALVLWIALAFASTLRGRLKHLAIGSALVALVLLIQRLCAVLYADPAAVTGSNSAYVLCGAAYGGNWQSCPQSFAQEFGRFTTERDQAAFLFSKTTELILKNPVILIGKMFENASYFVTGMPTFMLFGYRGGSHPPQEWSLLVLIPGLYFVMRQKLAHNEVVFWLLMFASMIASAALVFTDDGWRVMYATWPLVALFLSFGFASPTPGIVPSSVRPLLSVRSGLFMVAAAAALVIAAPGVTRLWPGAELERLSNLDSPQKADEAINGERAILVGRTVTGFIVIPDGAALPETVPALHAADFASLVRDADMERDYGKFLDDTLKHIPFAFVTAMRVINGDGDQQFYVAPVEILTGRASKAWRVTIDNRVQNSFVRDVTAIQRLP